MTLELREVVEIPATPGRVFEFFRHLDDNYRAWHPDHVSCRYLRGRELESGSVLRTEEYLHGRLHRLKLTLTKVRPGRGLDYRMFPGGRGGFRLEPTDHGTRLVAEIFLGTSIPFIGPLLDTALEALFSDRLAAIRQHMREEGANLRAILSQQTSSAPSA